MNKNWIKNITPTIFIIMMFFVIAASTKQLIGPSSSSTDRAIVRWLGTSGWQTTNSSVIIDDLGNISGINTLTVSQSDVVTAYVTNGFIYLQGVTPPTAASIGGTVGSVTNHMLKNIQGNLIDYWSDGTSLYSKQIAP